MKKLLDSAFESVTNYSKNAPGIISRLSVHKNKTRIKEAIEVCRDYLTNFQQPPIFKICAVKFLKDLFDEGLFYVLQLIQETILPIFKEIILYRQDVKSIKRGHTFLLSKEIHPIKGQDIIQMMSKFVKPSKSYFQLVHQCVFFWSQYIQQENSPFKKIYEQVNHCTFPTNHKHFKQNDVSSFKQKYNLEMNAIQYQLQDCIKKWGQVKDQLKKMQKKDFSRQNLEGYYNWIMAFVTQYTNLLVDLKDSYYYKRKGLQQKMLSLLVQKKQFLKLYIQGVNRNSFIKLYERYGKLQQINTDFGIEKNKKIKRKKVNVESEDLRLADIKKIYLADYPEILGKLEIAPVIVQRNKYYPQFKKQGSNNGDSPLKLPDINQNNLGNSKVSEKKSSLKGSMINQGSAIPNLKTSIVSNARFFINTPSLNNSPNILKSGNLQSSKLIINSPQQSPVIISHKISRNSLNNGVYHSSLIKSDRRKNGSLSILGNRSKIAQAEIRSTDRNSKKSNR